MFSIASRGSRDCASGVLGQTGGFYQNPWPDIQRLAQVVQRVRLVALADYSPMPRHAGDCPAVLGGGARSRRRPGPPRPHWRGRRSSPSRRFPPPSNTRWAARRPAGAHDDTPPKTERRPARLIESCPRKARTSAKLARVGRVISTSVCRTGATCGPSIARSGHALTTQLTSVFTRGRHRLGFQKTPGRSRWLNGLLCSLVHVV
jgi:hypothetical protein